MNFVALQLKSICIRLHGLVSGHDTGWKARRLYHSSAYSPFGILVYSHILIATAVLDRSGALHDKADSGNSLRIMHRLSLELYCSRCIE